MSLNCIRRISRRALAPGCQYVSLFCNRRGRSLALLTLVLPTSRLCLSLGQVVVFLLNGSLLAQQRVIIQNRVDLIVDPQMVRLLPVFQGPVVNSKPQLLSQVRGLIQNELSIICDLCGLDQKQQQTLVDLAESEWKAKTNASVIKSAQENVYGSIDLDGLCERVVRTWLEASATTDQLSKYDEELADRMRWRQKALVSRVLDSLEAKLNLSGIQLEQIEAILNEKWKDRWYRSLEATFDNSTLLPDIRTSWISPFLSDAQKAALVTRDPQTRFGTQLGSLDFPSIAIETRFTVGSTKSSDSIELEPVANKASKTDDEKIIDGIQRKAKAEDAERAVNAKSP